MAEFPYQYGSFDRIKIPANKLEYVGQILDNLGSSLKFANLLRIPLDPFNSLKKELQEMVTQNEWNFGTYKFGQKIAPENVSQNEFLTLFDTPEKGAFLVLSPPIYDKTGKVLRLGSLR